MHPQYLARWIKLIKCFAGARKVTTEHLNWVAESAVAMTTSRCLSKHRVIRLLDSAYSKQVVDSEAPWPVLLSQLHVVSKY